MAKSKKRAPARPAAKLKKKKKAVAKVSARPSKRKAAAKRAAPKRATAKRATAKRATAKKTSTAKRTATASKSRAVAAPAREGIAPGTIRRPAAIEVKLAIAKPSSLRIDRPERREIAMPVPMTLSGPIAPIAMRAPVIERSLPPHDREE